MNIVVCVKAVPDPKEVRGIRIDPVTKTLARSAVPLVMNSLDRHALEGALQLRESAGGSVTVISMGPPRGKHREGVHGDQRRPGDTSVRPCFRGSGWVGPQIAAFLNIPLVSTVLEFEDREEDLWRVRADWQNGYGKVEFRLPALLTVTRVLNRPRALSFSGILKARRKSVERWDSNTLGICAERLGTKGSPTLVSEIETVGNRREAEILQGTLEEKAEQLVARLAEIGALRWKRMGLIVSLGPRRRGIRALPNRSDHEVL